MTSVSEACAPQSRPSTLDAVVDTADDDFARQVLQLAHGDTEDAYHARIASFAIEHGVSEPSSTAPARPAQLSPSASYTRRSNSTDSQASVESSLTFDLSKRSNRVSARAVHPSQDRRRGSAASASTRDYDSSKSDARSSANTSFAPSHPTTPSQSTVSRPTPPTHSTSTWKTLIRGLSRLRLRRADSANSVTKLYSAPCYQRGI